MVLYQDVARRESSDLDILIKPEDFLKAYQIAISNGFINTSGINIGKLNATQIKTFQRLSSEISFEHSENNKIKVELHWNLFAPKSLFPYPLSELFSRSAEVEMSSYTLRTLSFEDQFLFLTIHGAKHKWNRLIWIHDIKELILMADNRINWEDFLAKCNRYGLQRPPVQALILCELLFNIPIPKPAKRIFEKDLKISKMTEDALIRLTSRTNEMDGMDPSNLYGITQNLMNLKIGLRHKLICISRLFISPKDWQILKLPPSLFFLYYLLRPVLYVTRTINGSFNKKA